MTNHTSQAESLLAGVPLTVYRPDGLNPVATTKAAVAQVHATLAVAEAVDAQVAVMTAMADSLDRLFRELRRGEL